MIKTALPMQGVRVQSLVGKLRSHMLPSGTAKKKKRKEKKEVVRVGILVLLLILEEVLSAFPH